MCSQPTFLTGANLPLGNWGKSDSFFFSVRMKHLGLWKVQRGLQNLSIRLIVLKYLLFPQTFSAS